MVRLAEKLSKLAEVLLNSHLALGSDSWVFNLQDFHQVLAVDIHTASSRPVLSVLDSGHKRH